MKRMIHSIAGILATLTIAIFFTSTICVELFGSHESIKVVKSLIVFPGLFILVPAIAATGATGFSMSGSRTGRLIQNKKKRMPFIAANGMFILVPSAIMLHLWAADGMFGGGFYALQTVEIVAGLANFVMMGLSIRDGLRLTGRIGPGKRLPSE